MMDLDVFYIAPHDLFHKSIKSYIEPLSINLAIYAPCLDFFSTKYNIRAIVPKLHHSGYIAIMCTEENISNVIQVVTDACLYYKVVYFISDEIVKPCVIGYKNELFKPNIPVCNYVESYDQIGSTIVNISQFKDTVCVMGNKILSFLIQAKALCRYVVGLGDEDLYFNTLNKAGIKICQ